MIFTVTLNPSVDYTIHVDRLVNGAMNRISKEEYSFGGKGINVSRMLAELGLSSTVLGFVAGFTGKAIEGGIRSELIKTDFVTVGEGFSRMKIKVVSGGETEFSGQGPVIGEEAFNAFMDRLDAIKDGDTVIISGNIPETMPQDIYDVLLSRLSEKDVRVALDLSGRQLLNCLGCRPFLIKPNLEEVAGLFDTDVTSREAVEFCAAQLQMMGAQNVLISMGGDGALLMAADGSCHRVRAVSGKVACGTGAGDSMLAGFVAGYEMKGDYGLALRLGLACGSATAFSRGPAKVDLIERLFHMYMKK